MCVILKTQKNWVWLLILKIKFVGILVSARRCDAKGPRSVVLTGDKKCRKSTKHQEVFGRKEGGGVVTESWGALMKVTKDPPPPLFHQTSTGLWSKREGVFCNRIPRHSEDSYKRPPLLFFTTHLQVFGQKERGSFVTEYWGALKTVTKDSPPLFLGFGVELEFHFWLVQKTPTSFPALEIRWCGDFCIRECTILVVSCDFVTKQSVPNYRISVNLAKIIYKAAAIFWTVVNPIATRKTVRLKADG